MGEKKIEIIKKSAEICSENTALKDKVKGDIVDILKNIFKSLLSQPNLASITVKQGDKTTIFEVDVVQADFGRMIGKRGQNITALRTLVASICYLHDFRGIIAIKDEDKFF